MQGCQFFTAKPAQLLLKTSPIAFQGGSPGKNRDPGVKYMIFGRVPLVKFTLQGINITLLFLE